VDVIPRCRNAAVGVCNKFDCRRLRYLPFPAEPGHTKVRKVKKWMETDQEKRLVYHYAIVNRELTYIPDEQ